jgi:hypothetical protein
VVQKQPTLFEQAISLEKYSGRCARPTLEHADTDDLIEGFILQIA